jgi:hypothetical protein
MAGRHALKVGREGDVIVLTASGLYTSAAHIEGRQLIEQEVARAPTRAVVVNLLGAIHVVGGEERRQMSDVSVEAGDPLRLPVALVVSQAMVESIKRQCHEMIARGHFWAPFLRLEDAVSWAARRPLAHPVAVA